MGSDIAMAAWHILKADALHDLTAPLLRPAEPTRDKLGLAMLGVASNVHLG
jgi:hypothetical protein